MNIARISATTAVSFGHRSYDKYETLGKPRPGELEDNLDVMATLGRSMVNLPKKDFDSVRPLQNINPFEMSEENSLLEDEGLKVIKTPTGHVDFQYSQDGSLESVSTYNDKTGSLQTINYDERGLVSSIEVYDKTGFTKTEMHDDGQTPAHRVHYEEGSGKTFEADFDEQGARKYSRTHIMPESEEDYTVTSYGNI